MSTLQYFLSSEINLPVAVKILSYHAPTPRPLNPLDDIFKFLEHVERHDREDDPNDVYMTLGIYAEGKPLISQVQIPKIHFKEWIRLPIKYRDLPLSTLVVLTLWSCTSPRKAVAVAGTSFSFFNKNCKLRKGKHKLRLWLGQMGDGSFINNATRGKISTKEDELWRIEKLVQEYKRGQITHVDWLDQITFKRIAELIESQAESEKSSPHMYIEFPTLEYTVFFHQKPNPDSSPSPAILSPTPFPPGTVIGPTRGGAADTSPRLSTQDNGFMTTVASAATSGPTAAILATSGADGGATSGGSAAAAQRGLVMLPNGGGRELVVVHDPEMSRENPVEGKYLKLIRYNRGLLDKDLKPDQKERTQLKKILNYPMTKHLTMDEKEFLWKFRYYLRTIPQALTKFMKCVDWEHKKDRKQAIKLIEEWEGIEVDDALELLSAAFKGINPVRRFAIRRLEKADDQELLSYLLQLVQALRYEKDFLSNEDIAAAEMNDNASVTRQLDARKHRGKAKSRLRKGKDLVGKDSSSAIHSSVIAAINNSNGSETDSNSSSPDLTSRVKEPPAVHSQLAKFLIHRGSKNHKLGNFLYWYLTVECEDKTYSKSFQRVLDLYVRSLEHTKDGQTQLKHFQNQKKLICDLTEMYHKIRALSKNRKIKIQFLKEWLEPYRKFDEPMPLPLNPDHIIDGIIPEKASIFGSAMTPFRLTFRTVQQNAEGEDEYGEYTIIYKCGDDLRQDQLIVQLISLMDFLLKKVHFDLQLTPYAVLATSCNEGMVEFIPSYPLSLVLSKYGRNIKEFLAEHNPDTADSNSSFKQALEVFIRSIAGYCVITYILGIGDRHMDNLLMQEKGNLFHIDFGFILGADPKPFAPPFKLTSQMVDAMGGYNSEEYTRFKSYCCSSFLILRKYANLILNLFSLMVDAGIPGIEALGGEKSILKVQEKFYLHLEDDSVIKVIQDLIQSSVDNRFAPIFDRLHDVSQTFK